MRTAKILLAAMLLTVVASAQQNRVFPGNWDTPTKDFPEKDMAWQAEKYPFENSSIYITEKLDSGEWFVAYLFTFKAPFGQRWGVIATVTGVDGKRHFFKQEIDQKDVEYRSDGIYIRMGKSYFDGRAPNYRAHFEMPGFTADLAIKNQVPTFKPGNGITYYTDDKKIFYENFIYSPFSRISGKMQFEGKTVDASGWGYGDRAHSNLSFMHQNKYIYSLRSFPKKGQTSLYSASMLEYSAHQTFNNLRIPWLIITTDKKYIVTTMNYKIEPSDFRKDDNTGYTYPWRFDITGSDKGVSFKITSQAKRIQEVLDVLTELPAALRPLAKKFFARPVFYRFIGDATGTVTLPDGTKATLDLEALSEITFIQRN